MTTLFISDLHLDPARPDISARFFTFLSSKATNVEALYILGDLFEAWIGDDDPEPQKRKVIDALKATSDRGVACFFTHGNRDFLIGKRFEQETGCALLDDPTVISLYGDRVLVMHGDLLCTDDVAYQAFRRTVRDPHWQRQFLAMSVDDRIAYAERAREGSRQHIERAANEIMDVNQGTVDRFMAKYDVDLLLHGHTHRPAIHHFMLDRRERTRIVLGDWYEQGSFVWWDEGGFKLEALT